MVTVKQKFLGNITILDKDEAGTITASDSRIVDLADPTNAQDAATKAYVDENSGTVLGIQQISFVPENAQTVFTLPVEPYSDGYVQMFVNGIKQIYGTDYTESGTSITYSGVTLETSDVVEFWFLTTAPSGGGGGDGYVDGDLTVTGKLTVHGLIDPTGMVFNEQSSKPTSTQSDEGLIWVRNDGYLIFTDQTNTDHIVDFDGVGGGGSSNLQEPTQNQDGYLAIASNGNLEYINGQDGYVLGWNENIGWTPQKIKYSTEYFGTASTTNNTPIDLLLLKTTKDSTAYSINTEVMGIDVNDGYVGGYEIKGFFKRISGIVTQIGATLVVQNNEEAEWGGAAYDVSGDDIKVTVTGAPATDIDWEGFMSVKSSFGSLDIGGDTGDTGGGDTGDTGGGDTGGGELDGYGYPFDMPPLLAGGWSDFKSMLVESDGSRALGTVGQTSITGRDQGSKIVFFDEATGNNTTAERYYWDGYNIIDPSGSTTNEDGYAYGSDPSNPNLAAIKPFEYLDGILPGDVGDARIRAFWHDFGQLCGGYPDWYLFRRGQTHTDFKMQFAGGRSTAHPMVIGAYGPKSDGRAIMDPISGGDYQNPFRLGRSGQSPIFCHMVFNGLDIVGGFSANGTNEAGAVNPSGEDASFIMEDCEMTKGGQTKATRILYPPKRTVVRRCAIGYSWSSSSHNQGYYTEGPETRTTFDSTIFYRNGYKSDPRLNADPTRDIFSRNMYEGGGARMGHVHKGIISADGASGGPQMRFGGLVENSLILEGYFFSSTNSNNTNNYWPTIQAGESAVVRNNVQLIYQYPTSVDPDPDGYSSNIAQPGAGYTIQGSSFGATIEGNIFSGAMLLDELGGSLPSQGLTIGPTVDTYPDGYQHTMKDVTISNNIIYRTNRGFTLQDTWTDVSNVKVSDNIFLSSTASNVSGGGPSTTSQLVVEDNKFYVTTGLPGSGWVGTGNTTSSQASVSVEGWSDPNRTLKRYVTEVLNLTLLTWDDDPYVDPAQAAARSAEAYDPTGLKTFMAVAMRMRSGGTDAIPSSGKPNMDADYPWDERFTGPAVVNWIRAGFNLDPV